MTYFWSTTKEIFFIKIFSRLKSYSPKTTQNFKHGIQAGIESPLGQESVHLFSKMCAYFGKYTFQDTYSNQEM